MKTVLVTPEMPIKTGGIGTFIWNFSKLLRDANQDTHILFTHPTDKPRKEWIAPFEKIGATVEWVHSQPVFAPSGYNWHMRVSEVAVDMIPAGADVIYFADWQAAGVSFVRSQRFKDGYHPVTVTVLHSSSRWLREAMRTLPSSYEEQWLDFSESYLARHSDFVVSPSRYLLKWAQDNGWQLPPEERLRVLGLPFFPPVLPTVQPLAVEQAGDTFKRIVFFGRLEARKGIDLFVEALGKLRGKPCLAGIQEIVLLGSAASNPYGEASDIIRALQAKVGRGIKVKAITKLNTFQAQSYLAERVDDTLVVIPSRLENFSLAVIEMSLIPRMNLICSNTGAIPEVLGPDGQGQFFEPFLNPMTRKLEESLLAGPQPIARRGRYDWEQANRQWLAFHQEACEHARMRKNALEVCVAPAKLHEVDNLVFATVSSRTAMMSSAPYVVSGTKSPVDLCITYYNLGTYLPYLLESLEQQTTQDFNLFIINDGSTDSKSIDLFEKMSQQHQRNGWHFITAENQGLSAARNYAASLGSAEYLIFMDADNIAAPNMVERFLDSIRRSGDDCLTCYMYHFRGEGSQYSSTGLLHPATYLYAPTGNSLLLGIFRNEFGDATCIVRRSVFDAINGFTTDVPKYLTGEDWEFFARLSFQGYELDVIPEYLAYYRVRDESMYRTTETFLNDARVLRQYEQQLRQVGLEGLATFTVGVYQRLKNHHSGISASNDLSYLVNHVSGHKILKALRIKAQNQIVRRLGLRH